MRACVVAVLVGIVACAHPKLERARHARYDAELARVFDAAARVASTRYRMAEVSPDRRTIKTAWVQVASVQIDGKGPYGPSNTHVARPGRNAHSKRFARFELSILGDRPFRIDVRGYGAEWRQGEPQPMPLPGEPPAWVTERADGLLLAIYKELEGSAAPPRSR